MTGRQVNVYKNKKTGLIEVHRMARHPTGAAAEVGTAAVLTPSELLTKGSEVLCELLAEFDANEFSSQLSAGTAQRSEFLRFARSNWLVMVYQNSEGTVIVTPTQRSGGSFVGIVEENIVIPLGAVLTRLAADVERAFLLCQS
jgi:hypothetical protein